MIYQLNSVTRSFFVEFCKKLYQNQVTVIKIFFFKKNNEKIFLTIKKFIYLPRINN